MKKSLILTLLFLAPIAFVNAQWVTPSSSDSYHTSGKVSINTTTFSYGLFLYQASNTTSNGYRFFQGTGTYGLKIGNSTTSGYIPTIWAFPQDSNDRLNILTEIEGADDTGTTPTIQINSRTTTSASISNRPILSIMNDGNTKMTILANGNVGIGESDPSEKLVVDGKLIAEEVKVQAVPSADYVFQPGYKLLSIQEVESFINENQHLPDIPSAQEFKKEGIGLGEMDNMLLRKVEELTLYMIDMQKQMDQLKVENSQLRKMISDNR